MSTNSVNFGGGNVTGYFYSAPANTPLPAYPLAQLYVQCGATDPYNAGTQYYRTQGTSGAPCSVREAREKRSHIR